MQKKVYIKT